MNEDALNDLKQFITTTVSQQLTLHFDDFKEEINEKFDEVGERFEKLEKKLSQQIQDLSVSVAEAMTTQNDETDKQLKDHETRIIALETKPV